jgi:hypothetical protein
MEKSIKKKRKIKTIELSPIKSKKEKIPYRSKTLENNYPDSFPKNANEFRHIIEDLKCCRADVEFMLQLRRHKKINNIEKIIGTEPTFYHDDLTKYKNRISLKPEEKKMLQINLGNYKYILSDRSKYAINYPTFKYEVKLRKEPYLSKSFDKLKKENNKDNEKKKPVLFNIKNWDSSNFKKNSDLFNTLLPPILPQSKEVFARNEKRIGRPIIIKKKESIVNGIKIRSRIFDYNSSLAFRYPSDHLPSSRYDNDYGVGNLGEISHLLKSDNRTMTNNWYSYLRGIKKKSVSPVDIRKTEKKLKDKSNQKSNFKF